MKNHSLPFLSSLIVIFSSICLAYSTASNGNMRLYSKSSVKVPILSLLKQNTSNKFALMVMHIDQTQTAKSVFDTINDCGKNLICAPIVTAAGEYFGVPVGEILALSAVISNLQFHGDEERSFDFKFPVGYIYCKSQMIMTSIVPHDGPRGSIFLAYAADNQISFSTWTPRQGFGGGRSWIEADMQVLAVQKEYAEQAYQSKQCFRAGERLLFKCRGGGCVNTKDTGQNVSNHTPGDSENNR